MKKVLGSLSLVWALLMVVSMQAQAYSYSAAGKEPLIDGREALLQAVNGGDFAAGMAAYDKMAKEVLYFKTEYGIDLDSPMRAAINGKSAEKVSQVLNQVYVAEIERRLKGAETNIGDYQVSKVLVVKSKLFLDLLLPQMDAAGREKAEQAIQGALTSIGNPGVFGVGAAPADPDALTKSHQALIQALKVFSL